jgi:HEPN domain-containing protein
MRPEDELVQDWLLKARNDLASAERLLSGDRPILDTGCFHCQQTVEKLLKAFLAYHAIEFEKSHSLVYLLDLCVPVDESFRVFYPAAQDLTVYAVGIRYPGFTVPSMNEAQKVLEDAHHIWEFVLQRIPAHIRP